MRVHQNFPQKTTCVMRGKTWIKNYLWLVFKFLKRLLYVNVKIQQRMTAVVDFLNTFPIFVSRAEEPRGQQI